MTLVWKRVPAATTYRVYRSTTPGNANPAQIAAGVAQRALPRVFGGTVEPDPKEDDCGDLAIDLLQVAFADSSVQNGTKYYYQVAADAEAAKSAEIPAQPVAASGALSKDRFLKIMPLGNSITSGWAGPCNYGGYRDTLASLLTADHFKFEFVGSQTRTSKGMSHPLHEGWNGREAKDLLHDVVDQSLPVHRPDIILLEIGTNSIVWTEADNPRSTTAAAYFDSLLDRIITLRPGASVLVSPIPPILNDAGIQSRINQYNAAIKASVAARKGRGKNVGWVAEMESLAYGKDDWTDNVHPSAGMYRKQGAIWFRAIQGILGTSGLSGRRAPGGRDAGFRVTAGREGLNVIGVADGPMELVVRDRAGRLAFRGRVPARAGNAFVPIRLAPGVYGVAIGTGKPGMDWRTVAVL